MFGHGQIEGFTEKYGMEYRWPRYQEDPDHWLVERHEREVAPLLKRRWLFAESAHFLLYDFFHRQRLGERRRLRLFQSHRRRARSRGLSQPLCRRARHHRFLRRLRRQGIGPASPAPPGRRPGPERRPRRGDRLARLAHRPRISAPRRRFARSRPHPQSPRLPVPRLSRLARAPRHGREALGPARRLAQRARRSPRSTRNSSISSCSPCTMRCARSSIPAWCGTSPMSPTIRAPWARREPRRSSASAPSF